MSNAQDRLICTIDRMIALIDAKMAAQLDEILHHERLRRLEGSWRGLFWLARKIRPRGKVKLQVLNVSWIQICRDFERVLDIDQAELFKKIYSGEFGMAGGDFYGLLVVDHEVCHQPGEGRPTDDIAALKGLAATAAAAFAPMVVNAAPALLDVADFTGLSGLADPAAMLTGTDYQRWNSLRDRDDSRFLAIALPRTLARVPWVDDPAHPAGFPYRETAARPEHRVWSGAGFAIAACVIRSAVTYAWPADMRGYEADRVAGGVIDDLPVQQFSTDMPGHSERPPLEVMLSETQEHSLVAAGLLPVSSLPGGPYGLIGAAPSLQRASTAYGGPAGRDANANAALSAQFNSIICVARFAHYIKIISRGLIGSGKPARQIQDELQNWLRQYSASGGSASAETLAKYPLRGASTVSITETPGRPGVFSCVIQLQPHYQLDNTGTSFRLTTELAARGARV